MSRINMLFNRKKREIKRRIEQRKVNPTIEDKVEVKPEMTILKVYMKTGDVFDYDVRVDQVREHAAKIIMNGYRHNDGKTVFEHYPPHEIDKVKVEAWIPTKYPDRRSGT